MTERRDNSHNIIIMLVISVLMFGCICAVGFMLTMFLVYQGQRDFETYSQFHEEQAQTRQIEMYDFVNERIGDIKQEDRRPLGDSTGINYNSPRLERGGPRQASKTDSIL